MLVMALDPGRTTGYAIIDTHELGDKRLFDKGELHTQDARGLADLGGRIRFFRPDQIICEAFEHRNVTGVDYTPIEIIGVVRMTAFEKKVPLLLQSPSVKTFWSNQKLRAIKEYEKGFPHCNDAMRHLLYWDTFINKHNYWTSLYNMFLTHGDKA